VYVCICVDGALLLHGLLASPARLNVCAYIEVVRGPAWGVFCCSQLKAMTQRAVDHTTVVSLNASIPLRTGGVEI
jgi:hypothetical protein